MLGAGIRAFVAAAVICAPAVFGEADNAATLLQSRFNALDELSLSANRTQQVINETYNRVAVPQENQYEMIERQGVLAELQKKTAFLKQENEQLTAAKNSLLDNCNGKLRQLTEAYNSIVASLNVDVPELRMWERRLQTSMLTREMVVKALTEVTELVGLLGLKKSVLIEDIALLEAREGRYPECWEYRRLFTVGPGIAGATLGEGLEGTEDPERMEGPEVPEGPYGQGGEIQMRSGPIVLRSRSAADLGRILFERKRALLDVKLEQETHVNRELKNVIKFYVGYCSRSVESLKMRIELLRAYPAGEHSLDELKGQVSVVESEIVQKKGDLATLKDTLVQLAAEVRELQGRYDAMREMADCFLELARFRVDRLVESVSRTIVSVEQRGSYSEQGMVLEDADGSAPLQALPEAIGAGPLPGGPAPPLAAGLNRRQTAPPYSGRSLRPGRRSGK